MERTLIKGALALSILISFSNAYACKVPTSTNSKIRSVVEHHGGWPISEARCNFLRKNNLYINISGDAAVITGVNVGLADLALQDINLNIISDQNASSTYVNTDTGNQATADDQLYTAIEHTIKDLDWDQAINQIKHYRALAHKR